ncbi:MAG: peptidylprolyl isomerase [Polyangiales bacterium]
MTVRRSMIVGALALSAVACSKKTEPQFDKDKAPAAETPKNTEPAAEPTPAPTPPAQPAITREPTSPDPIGGKFSLAEATAELPKKGALHASIETDEGTLDCKLFDDKAPITVANFVGLARGLRPFWDPKSATWEKRPLYDGTTFHRTIQGFMIQGGDHLGDGTGGVGYEIPDELAPGLSHDRAGLLCMANRGPNTNGGQFFITDASTPHLTQMKSYSIFGECSPVDVIHKIAAKPSAAHSDRPSAPVTIKKVTISKK